MVDLFESLSTRPCLLQQSKFHLKSPACEALAFIELIVPEKRINIIVDQEIIVPEISMGDLLDPIKLYILKFLLQHEDEKEF